MVALLAIAACSGTGAPARAPGADTPSTNASVVPPPVSAIVGFAARTQMIESRHGGEITAIAVTPEGNAVISVDELGGTRLWPVLDGSVEPRVVDLPQARSLAIGLHERGFVVGSVDVAGGLTIAVVDRDGLILQRASLPAEPPFVDIAMTSRGMIATRSDHAIVRLGADGSIVERIAVGTGERIAGLWGRGDKLVVQIEGAEKRTARWLLVAPSLTWGAVIPMKIDPQGILAVSPSGSSIALIIGPDAQRWFVVVDTASGAVLDGEAIGGVSTDIEYADDDHVVLGGGAATRVHRIDPKRGRKVIVVPLAPTQRDPDVLAGGGELVVGPASAQLALVARGRKEYLGYAIESPTVVATAPGGTLVVGDGATFAQVDNKLATVSTPDWKLPPSMSVADLRHVDGNGWLVEWASTETGRTSSAFIDLATGARQMLHTNGDSVHAIGYDVRSRLATFTMGNENAVFRFDPTSKKFKRLDAKNSIKWHTVMTPLAPDLANGSEVLVVTLGDRVTVRWVRDVRARDKGTSLVFDGTFAAADPLGNAYVWTHDKKGFALSITRDGKQVARLTADRPVAIAPDPAGKRYVEIARNEVALVSHDGSRAWAFAVPGVNEAHWLTDGSIALVGTGGLARVDTATGTIQAARCGWRFGLSKTQPRTSSRVEPLCTQLR